MPRRVPIAPSLPDTFLVKDALEAGHRRGRMRGRDLERPFRGVRTRVGDAPPHPLDRIRQYAPLLRPGDRFSHTSAALLYGAPVPRGAAEVVHVTSALGSQPRAAGVVGHRGGRGEVVVQAGVAASDPVGLFLELASMLAVDDLVGVGDHLVLDPAVLDPRDPRPWMTEDELRRAVDPFRGRGARTARAAVALVRAGAESPQETRLRLLLSRAGLPEPKLNLPIRGRDGRMIGRFDLCWPEQKVLVEYDGDQHRTSTRQYEKDIRRFDLATDADWRVVRVRRYGLSEGRAETIERVRRALAR